MVPFNRVVRTVMLCSPLVLAACQTAQTPPPMVAASPVADAKIGGIYKVGTPYQVEGIWYYPAEDYGYVEEGIASWYGKDFHGKRTANGDRYNMEDITAAHPTLPMPSVVTVTNLENGKVLRVTVNDRGPFHSRRIIDVSRRAAQMLGFYEKGTARVRVQIDPEESITLKNIALKKNPPAMPQVAAAPRGVVSASTLEPAAATQIPAGTVKPVATTPPVVNTPAAKPAVTAPAQRPAQVAPGEGVYVQAGAFSEEANARKLEQQLGELGPVHIVPVTINNRRLYRVRLGPLPDAAMAPALVAKVKSYGYGDAKVVRE